MRPYKREAANGTQFIRQWKLLVLLRQRPRSLQWLARELGTCDRTVRRDIAVLEMAGMPIGQIDGDTESLWYAGVLPEWPRREAMPVCELRVGD